MDPPLSTSQYAGVQESGEQSRQSLRAALFSVLLASLIPIMLGATVFLFMQWNTQRKAAMGGLHQRAQTLALAVERELETNFAILQTLAAMPQIDAGDWAGFHAVAKAATRPRPFSWVALGEPSGQLLLNSNLPFGVPLPNLLDVQLKLWEVEWQGRRLPSADPLAFEPARSGRSIVMDLFYGVMSERPALAVAVPVLRNGKPSYSLMLGFTPDALASLLARERGSATTVTAVVDGNGKIIARSDDTARYLGTDAVHPFDQPAQLAVKGEGDTTGSDGGRVFYAYRHLSRGSWTVVVAIPREDVYAPVYRTIVPWLIATLLLLGIGAYLAHRLQRRLVLPLSALARSAESFRRGEMSAIPASGIREIDSLSHVLQRTAQSEKVAREQLSQRLASEQEATALAERLADSLRKSEAEVRALNAELEQRVRERSASLEQKSGQLQEATAALRINHEQLHALLENVPVNAYLKDLEGRIVLTNSAFARSIGARPEDVIGKTMWDFFPDEVVAPGEAQDRQVVATGEAMELEITAPMPAQGTRTYLAIRFPVRDAEGRIYAVGGIGMDVTEHKRAERELAQTLGFLRAILYSANYAIISTDAAGIIRTFNPAAERMLAYSAGELVGKATPERFHDAADVAERAAASQREFGEAVHNGFEALIARAKRQKVDDEERIYVRKDGTRFPVQLSVTAVRDAGGNITGYLGIAADITERKHADEEVRAARARFAGILEIAADAIVSVDRAQRITLFNKGAEHIFGYRADEILGKHLDTLIPPRYRAVHGAHIAEFAGSGDVTRRMDARLPVFGLHRDGTEFPAEASISKLDLNGETVFTAMLRDITERKQAEAAIERLNRALERRAAELESVNRELEAFSYSVSHDLRAPLRGIDGFSQVLLEDYANQLDEEGRDSLRRIRAASQRMAQLIDDMLKLSRLSRAEMHRETVDLSALAHAIAEELHTADPLRKVRFDIEEGAVASGDARLLRVVLENLLGNAWKYTSHHASAHIEFGAKTRNDGMREYFVRDDGAGFDMAYAGKLFGAFQRLHANSEFPGTGVGLTSVQRIIHRHGGEVWAESAVEAGATFHFTLAEDAVGD